MFIWASSFIALKAAMENLGPFTVIFLRMLIASLCFVYFIKSFLKYDFSKKDIKFIVNNANKEVLCYICHRWEDNPDIFVYGDDNIAFQVGCFE